MLSLIDRIRRALYESRDNVEIGGYWFRAARRGDVWSDDNGEELQANESGLFAAMPVEVGGKLVGRQWLKLGSGDDLEELLQPYVEGLSLAERDALAVRLTASAALNAVMSRQRSRAERRLGELAGVGDGDGAGSASGDAPAAPCRPSVERQALRG